MKSAHFGALAGDADRVLGDLTPASIAEVKDFTARKTLEQAHAFAGGLAAAFLAPDGGPDALSRSLASVGVSLADAEQIAVEGACLVELLADRDRKADAYHAAIAAAGEGERALYERLASFARLLRLKLGASSPALSAFGVPPEAPPRRPRSVRPPPP